MPLALFSPLPRPVVLAGRPYLARPLRLRDLFALADLAAGEPPGVPEGDDHAALKSAFDAAEAWPGRWSDALDTAVGRLALLRACLRDERMGDDALIDLMGAMDAPDWSRLTARAFGSDPAASIASAIDAAIGVPDAPGGGSWPKAIARFWRAQRGLSEADLLDVTLPMFRLAMSEGERNVVDPDSTAEAQEKRRVFWANGHAT